MDVEIDEELMKELDILIKEDEKGLVLHLYSILIIQIAYMQIQSDIVYVEYIVVFT